MFKIFILFILSLNVFSQEMISIKGKLLERGTKKPMKEVSVFILPHKIKAITDVDGKFEFSNIPKGECELIVNFINYNKLSKLNICENATGSITLFLEKTFYTTFETTIKSKVNKRDDQAQNLTQEEFLTMPGSFGGDPVRAAQNLPGVAQSGSSAQIIIQGAAPEDTGYVINGHQVPIVFHFGGLSSVIIPEAVDRVEMLPSGYGPEYGRAVGGIIGLTTKSPTSERSKGMAYVDLLNAGGMLEAPIDETSHFLVAGRYSYIGVVLKAIANKSDNFKLTAAPTYYDFTSLYEKKINSKNIFKTTLVASHDELSLILNKNAANDPALRGNLSNTSEFFRIIPELTTELENNSKMNHSIAVGRDIIFFNIDGQYLDIKSTVVTQRSEFSKVVSPRYKYYVGLDNQFEWAKVLINLPSVYTIGGVNNPFSTGEERKFGITDSASMLGAYFRQEIKTFDESPWTYLPNLRFDYFSPTKESFVQPRLQARYQYDPSLLLRGSVGQYYQLPKPQEYTEHYGNPKLKSIESLHVSLGWSKDFRNGGTKGLEFTNNFFYKDLKNIVVPDVSLNYSNNGSGKIYGGEIQAKFKWNDWSSQLVYTYLDSSRTIPGYGTRPSQYDQTHNLNLIGSLNQEKWTYSARLRLVSGNPYTPITGGTFDTDNDVYLPSRREIFSQRFGLFNQLDIRIDRKYIYDTWILTAYLDIQNIMNAKNQSSIKYSYDYTQNEKVNGLPILPTFGVKGEF